MTMWCSAGRWETMRLQLHHLLFLPSNNSSVRLMESRRDWGKWPLPQQAASQLFPPVVQRARVVLADSVFKVKLTLCYSLAFQCAIRLAECYFAGQEKKNTPHIVHLIIKTQYCHSLCFLFTISVVLTHDHLIIPHDLTVTAFLNFIFLFFLFFSNLISGQNFIITF